MLTLALTFDFRADCCKFSQKSAPKSCIVVDWVASWNLRVLKNLTATLCNTLQHTATHCNTLQHTATRLSSELNPEGDPLSLNVSAETLSIFPTFPLSPLWDSLSLPQGNVSGVCSWERLSLPQCTFPLSPLWDTLRERESLSGGLPQCISTDSHYIPSLSLMGYIKGERISLWRSPSMYQHRLSLHSLSLPLSMAAPWSWILRVLKNLTATHATHCNSLQHTATHCNTLQHDWVASWILRVLKNLRISARDRIVKNLGISARVLLDFENFARVPLLWGGYD